MLRPLFANQRRTLLRAGAHACAASMLLAALATPYRFEATAQGQPHAGRFNIPDVPARLEYPKVAVQRDPFVSNEPTPEPDGAGALDALVLPPNDAVAATPIVRAIVRGDTPRALVDVGGRMETLGIGDVIAGTRVTAIGAQGVVLDDGETLPFTEKTP